MSTAPDVLWLRDGELYDDTDRAWRASNLQPLTVPEPEPPLRHRDGCRLAEWPDLAELCPCTADQRYAHRNRAEVAL